MKATSTALSVMVVALVFVLALGFIAQNTLAAGGKKIDITGKVEQGKFVADNGKEYAFADNAKSQELMSKHNVPPGRTNGYSVREGRKRNDYNLLLQALSRSEMLRESTEKAMARRNHGLFPLKQ